MKKIAICLLAALTVMLWSCDTKKQKEDAQVDTSAQRIDSLENALAQAQNETNDLMGTVEQIRDGFTAINEAEDIITTQSAKGESSDRQAILSNMALIQKKMNLNRELIKNLQEQLRTSKSSNAKMKSTLEQMVADFQKQLQEKQTQLDELRAELNAKNIKIQEQDKQISTLNQNVSSLSQDNEAQANQIAEQDKVAHTVYYVFGTKKELKAQKILQDGDVLKSNDFNRDYFAKVDYRVKKVIPLYSKSAKILTNHPVGTYRLDRDANKQYTLRITDPDRFWSVTKYLVIIVK